MRGSTAIFLLGFLMAACTQNGGTTNGTTANPMGTARVDTVWNDTLRLQKIEQLVQKGAPQQALPHIEQLLQKDSINPGLLYIKADALEKSGDTAAAIQYYQKAIQQAGMFDEAALRLANLYAETGNNAALQLCDQLLQQATAVRLRSELLHIKGIYYGKVRQFSRALAVYDQIIREDYSYLDAYIEKGLLYFDQADYEKALAAFRTSTTVKNSFADGYYWMARTEEKLGRTEEAIANYKRCLALDQSFTEARDALRRLGVIRS